MTTQTTHHLPKAQPAPLITAAMAVVALIPLAILGVLVRWPVWAIVSFAVIATTTVVVAAWWVRSSRRSDGDRSWRARVASVAVPVVALVVAAGCLAVTVTHWTVPERERPGDREAVAAVAQQVAQKVATLTAGNTERYLADLEPYVTLRVSRALQTKIVDLLPAHVADHDATVRAVSIELLHPLAASVVAVIDRRIVAPAGQTQPVPDEIRLWLIMVKIHGRWYADNLGLAI